MVSGGVSKFEKARPDAAFQKMVDPSGRAVTDVHQDGYKKT